MLDFTPMRQRHTRRSSPVTNGRAAAASPSPADLDEKIYTVVRRIPRGKVAAYGWVAERAGIARGARRVGRALRILPAARRVPWHRVINAQGRISFPAGSASARQQRRLLEAEGVTFKGHRVDLDCHGWRVNLDEWLWRPD